MSQDGIETTHERIPSASNFSWASTARLTNFTACGDEDDLRVRARDIGEHIGAARDTGGGRISAPIQGWQGLARQHQDRWFMAQLHNKAVSFDYLIGVAWPERDQSGNGAE